MKRLLVFTITIVISGSCDFLLLEEDISIENEGIKYEKVIEPRGDSLILFKPYQKPFEEIDFDKWLNQFEILSESRIVYDYYSDPIDFKGPIVNTTIHFKNGMVVDYFSMYESMSVKVKLPFINRVNAINLFNKINIDNLTYDQRNISFTNYNFGVIIEFGGGL